ncbi:hypothetical protein BDV19DRAFT_172814 [Aspergillus venezuelensis]
MTSEPSEEAITSFTSITNTSREQAISFLKANDLDSNKAINAYFEDPTGPHTQASAYQSQAGASAYQIEHSDAVPASPTLIPPSRPPSTSNTKDAPPATQLPPPPPAQDNKAASNNGLTLAEQEEQQLQQAVAMSLNPNLGQQETGITNSTQKFGPATRDNYDQGDWAMTLFNSSAREIVISPDPIDRKKQAEEPPFIRPSQDSLHLHGLLTILHSIPLAREALLLRNNVLSNYGKDAQWWNGQPINLPKVVTIDQAQYDDTDWDDILYESQRIIAFLDSTNRAFGSADALAGLRSMSTYSSENSVCKFLESWQEAAVRADSGNPLTTVFSSMAYKQPPQLDENMAVDEFESPIDKEFFTLEPTVEPVHGQTLYDVLDGTMWADSLGEELDDVWLEHVADILTIQLDAAHTANAVDVKVPATFYPDRYLASCRDIAREYRLQRLEIREDVLKLQNLMDRISVPKATPGIPSRIVLEKAADAAVALASEPESTESNSARQIASQLHEISRKIEDKLKELGTRQREAEETLRSYSKYLTEPSDTPGEPPVHKYTLRGVCTEPHVTYVLRRNPPTETDPNPTGYQWWRLSFSVDDAKARHVQTRHAPPPKDTDVIGYTARKVREVEVLRAAREESKTVTLIYANANAMSYKEEAAPSALQTFVNTDNAFFASELEEWESTSNQQPHNPANNDSDNEWPQSGWTNPTHPSPSLGETGAGEDVLASKVNVFDYQVSSFDNSDAEKGSQGQSSTQGQEMQEMQERGGGSLLGQTTGVISSKQDSGPEWGS